MEPRGGGEGVGVLPPPFKWFVTAYIWRGKKSLVGNTHPKNQITTKNTQAKLSYCREPLFLPTHFAVGPFSINKFATISLFFFLLHLKPRLQVLGLCQCLSGGKWAWGSPKEDGEGGDTTDLHVVEPGWMVVTRTDISGAPF